MSEQKECGGKHLAWFGSIVGLVSLMVAGSLVWTRTDLSAQETRLRAQEQSQAAEIVRYEMIQKTLDSIQRQLDNREQAKKEQHP